MKTDRKPPLARSPTRPRARRVLQPSNINTPLDTMTKPQMKESENQTISCEFTALSKMVYDQLDATNPKKCPSTGATNCGSSLEKGLFYDEYIAIRNERLRKKQSKSNKDEPKTAYSLGVRVESGKKKEFKKKAESVKISKEANNSIDEIQQPRYVLRSRVKKPPLPLSMDVDEKSTTGKTNAASRSRRI